MADPQIADGEVASSVLTKLNNILKGVFGSTNIETTGTLAGATLNTGQGANELYAMNQDVRTTDDVAFKDIVASGTVKSTATTQYNYDQNFRAVVKSVTEVDINADILRVQGVVALALDLTVDITASGANGLDTGTEGADSRYAVWVIYNPTTSTFAGLLSLSTTDPTMPEGYTLKRLVSSIKNTSGDLVLQRQYGNYIDFNTKITVLDDGTSGSFTEVSLANHIDTTLCFKGEFSLDVTKTSATSTYASIAPHGLSTNTSGNVIGGASGTLRLSTNTACAIVDGSIDYATNGTFDLYLKGCYLNLGLGD